MKNVSNILIFRIGQLGDTLVSVPAMWAIREHFPDARTTLLCDGHVGKRYVLASDVLEGSGLVDNFILYPVDRSRVGRVLKVWQMLILLARLRAARFDALVYLVPSQRIPYQIKRDIRFFGLAGINQFYGTNGFQRLPEKVPGKPLPTITQEGDLLLARLAGSGIPVPRPGHGRLDVNIGEQEQKEVERWLFGLPMDGGRKWIGLGIGGKRPVTIWPSERYALVVESLISDFDIWPVVFGGPEDRDLGKSLVSQWGRGYVAAGKLKVREGIAALSRCVLFLGNDTGTMHMAAAAGVRCVGIYSSRNYPGRWVPYGEGHRAFRSSVPCEGCRLDICNEYNMRCILSISVEDVLEACRGALADSEISAGMKLWNLIYAVNSERFSSRRW